MTDKPSTSGPSTPDTGTVAATRLDFSALPGWAADDHGAALAAFLRGCTGSTPRTGTLGIDGDALAALCETARKLPAGGARAFFEAAFVPVALETPGFVTGYFEPLVAASRQRSARFSVPLHGRPDDLVKIGAAERAAARRAGLDADTAFARRLPDGRLAEYFDRGEIAAGALEGRAPVLAYVADPLDAFFIHIQGSARLALAEGGTLRLGYAAKSGHAYTPIGRILIERGEIAREDMTMERLRSWLAAHPDEARALMNRNRSYIFFREVAAETEADGPVGAAGVPLSAGRSLAVDRALHTFGTPIFVSGRLPQGADGEEAPFARLMIAQDTGSAIVGPARGDIFFGTGAEAGQRAGRLRHPARFVVLAPRGSKLAARARDGDPGR